MSNSLECSSKVTQSATITPFMPIDLFKDDLSHVSGSVLYESIDAFTRTFDPEANRPREGYTLDFKESWSDKALQTVAAFAHTFGGLLIIGVSEKDGLPEQLVGVSPTGELKTTIASSIATNISPTPQYEIAECSLLKQPDRKLAVVRVRKGNELYYYTKKNERYPVYVRNEDESVPANAAQLRALIEQYLKRTVPDSNFSGRVQMLRSSLQLHQSPGEELGHHVPTSLHVLLCPLAHPGLILDSSVENQFREIVRNNFLVLEKTDVTEEENRYHNWYRYGLFRAQDGYEKVWEITSTGDIGHITQIRLLVDRESYWSLGDRVADIVSMLKVAADFWKLWNYFGEARLLVDLTVGELPLYKLTSAPGFPLSYNSDWVLDGRGIKLSEEPYAAASASLDINFATLTNEMPDTVTHILNQLLRSMKHTANLATLKTSVRVLLAYLR